MEIGYESERNKSYVVFIRLLLKLYIREYMYYIIRIQYETTIYIYYIIRIQYLKK